MPDCKRGYNFSVLDRFGNKNDYFGQITWLNESKGSLFFSRNQIALMEDSEVDYYVYSEFMYSYFLSKKILPVRKPYHVQLVDKYKAFKSNCDRTLKVEYQLDKEYISYPDTVNITQYVQDDCGNSQILSNKLSIRELYLISGTIYYYGDYLYLPIQPFSNSIRVKIWNRQSGELLTNAIFEVNDFYNVMFPILSLPVVDLTTEYSIQYENIIMGNTRISTQVSNFSFEIPVFLLNDRIGNRSLSRLIPNDKNMTVKWIFFLKSPVTVNYSCILIYNKLLAPFQNKNISCENNSFTLDTSLDEGFYEIELSGYNQIKSSTYFHFFKDTTAPRLADSNANAYYFADLVKLNVYCYDNSQSYLDWYNHVLQLDTCGCCKFTYESISLSDNNRIESEKIVISARKTGFISWIDGLKYDEYELDLGYFELGAYGINLYSYDLSSTRSSSISINVRKIFLQHIFFLFQEIKSNSHG